MTVPRAETIVTQSDKRRAIKMVDICHLTFGIMKDRVIHIVYIKFDNVGISIKLKGTFLHKGTLCSIPPPL